MHFVKTWDGQKIRHHRWKVHQIHQFFMGFHVVLFKIRKLWRPLRADTHRPSPPTCFWAANSTNSSSKCSRDDLASRSQICKSCITKVGRGFESRRSHKNFNKKTFFPISKNVKYRSVACLRPKLWAFWVLLLSYNCTTVWQNPNLLRSYDGTKEVLALDQVSMQYALLFCLQTFERLCYRMKTFLNEYSRSLAYGFF